MHRHQLHKVPSPCEVVEPDGDLVIRVPTLLDDLHSENLTGQRTKLQETFRSLDALLEKHLEEESTLGVAEG